MASPKSKQARPRDDFDSNDQNRTVRIMNVRLLGVTCAMAALLGVAGYFWYAYRLGQVTDFFLVRAASLENDEKWQDAASYLRRYLQVNPNDRDARVRLIQALEQVATTPSQRRQLVALYYEVLGQFNEYERDDLRIKLAQQLLEMGDSERDAFVRAEAAALKVVEPKRATPASAADQQAARKVIAISQGARAQRGSQINLAALQKNLTDSLEDDPGDTRIAPLTADLFRTHPDEVGGENAALKADEIMDRLVATAPDDPDALLARYSYRRRYRLPNARQDLDTLLKKDPDHIEALLLVANEDYAQKDPQSQQAAEESLKRVTQLSTQDPRGFIGLASIYVAKGNRTQATDLLTDARKHFKFRSLELDAVLAGLLLDSNRLDEAERVISDVDSERRRRLPESSIADRRKQDKVCRLLKARLHYARNDLQPAIAELSAITRGESISGDVAAASVENIQAFALLATIMTKMERFDLAAPYWKTVADVAPQLSDAGWKAGAAYLEAGRPDEAIEQLERYMQVSTPSPEAWITLMQSHLQKQMRTPKEERNWSEFSVCLAEAKRKVPDRWEPRIAEAVYALSKAGDETSRNEVKALLRKCENDFSSEAALWGRLVWLYVQLESPGDADRALARYEELEKSVVRRISLRAARLVHEGRLEDASKLLMESLPSVAPNEQQDLQAARVRLLVAARDIDRAQQLVAELIDASKENARLLALGIDIALQRRDFDTAKEWEDALKSRSNVDDFEWRFFRSRRLLEQHQRLDEAQRAELDQLIESLRSSRPSWFPGIVLAGQHAELRGLTSDAIGAYKRAIELGDTRPDTLRRLVGALYADGQFNEADAYLTRLRTELPEDGGVESLAIVSAARGNRSKEALDLAQTAVKRGSKDPMHHVWYGSLLLLNGKEQAAETVFRKSVEQFPTDSRVWNGLFTFLVRSRQNEEALRTLEEWPKSVGLEGSKKHSVLAQGYEALGDIATAQREYQAAIELDASDVECRIRLAKLLFSSNPGAARAQYEQVLGIDPENADARRQMAAILAASGGSEDWNRALKLLATPDGHGSGDTAGMDDRLRAILLARRGKNREERMANLAAARQILLMRLSQGEENGNDIDRKLLVDIYEQEWRLRVEPNDKTSLVAARGAVRSLVSRAEPPVEYLVYAIEFSLRHLSDISSINDDAIRTELIAMLTDDADLRINDLEAAIGETAAESQQILPIAYRARLLALQDRDEEAKEVVIKFANQRLPAAKEDADRTKLYLQIGNILSAIEQYAEAEKWYRQLVKLAPNGYVLLARSLAQQERLEDAVEVCLRANGSEPSSQAATVIAQLLSTSGASMDVTKRAEDVINAALKRDKNNVELLMSVAVQQVTKGNSAEAMKLFRKAIDVDPNHVVARNNLATLLSEQPNQLGEARQQIERAMDVSGRSPALLDTLGTILVRSGAYAEAIGVLEESVAGGATDPRYHFHLAVAYSGAGRDADARQALATAREKGLDNAILTEGDRELLITLEKDSVPISAGI